GPGLPRPSSGPQRPELVGAERAAPPSAQVPGGAQVRWLVLLLLKLALEILDSFLQILEMLLQLLLPSLQALDADHRQAGLDLELLELRELRAVQVEEELVVVLHLVEEGGEVELRPVALLQGGGDGLHLAAPPELDRGLGPLLGAPDAVAHVEA